MFLLEKLTFLCTKQSIEVYIDNNTEPLLENEVNVIDAAVPHTVTVRLPEGENAIGHYLRASSSSGHDASGALRPVPGDADTKGGTSWDSYGRPVNCDEGVSAVTQSFITPLQEVNAQLFMAEEADVNLEINIMITWPGNPSFYYTNFQINFQAPETPVASPSSSPTTSQVPSLSPTSDIVSTTTCVSDVDEYEFMYSLSNEVTFYWNSTTADSEYMVGRIHTSKKAYVSWAVAPDRRGRMVGSEAIVGLPELPNTYSNPGKYHMVNYFLDGTYLMDDSQQTLMEGSHISQDDSGTTLSFVKKLVEVGEVPILPVGENTFSWAIGANNDLNWHPDYGVFYLDLSAGCDVAQQRLSDHKANWKLHGLLMAIAWGGAAPLALIAAQMKFWRVSSNLNFLCFLCTTIAIGIAHNTVNEEGMDHFEGTHPISGLVVFVFYMFHLALEIVVARNINKRNLQENESNEVQKNVDKPVRIETSMWHLFLYISRYTLLISCAFVMYFGLETYNDHYGEKIAKELPFFITLAWAFVWVITKIFACYDMYQNTTDEDNILQVTNIYQESLHRSGTGVRKEEKRRVMHVEVENISL